MESRVFNSVTIINDSTIRKSSINVKKILAEYEWYKNDVFNHPYAYNYRGDDFYASYDMNYIHGRTLLDVYVNERLPIDDFIGIIDFLLDKINTSKTDRSFNYDNREIFRKSFEDLYTAKTISRLRSANIDLSKKYKLNGIQLPSLKKIIEDSKVSVDLEDICVIHGDMCFSNIILDDEFTIENAENHMFFIDPRGYVLNDGKYLNTIYGDYKYDIGKILHSLVGGYDLIKANILSASLDNDNLEMFYETTSYKEQLKSYILTKLKTEYKCSMDVWYNIMINLFLSMIPLHSDNPGHQTTMLANALRLHLEKEQTLN